MSDKRRGQEGKRARGQDNLCHCEEGEADEAIQKENYPLFIAYPSLKEPAFLPSCPLALKALLDSKSCFKLICGAGNENLDEVAKLVALYSAAGCRFFDFAANEEVLAAAQRGLDFSIPKDEQNDYHFCVSIGTKGDRHVQKAQIDVQKCTGCGKCVEICPQRAIINAVGQECPTYYRYYIILF